MTNKNLQETKPMQDTKQLFSKSLNEIKRLKAINQQLEKMHKEPVAIVGAACRYPGGIGSLEQFWEALEQGRDCIETMHDQRWPMSRFFTDDPHVAGGIYSDAMGLLGDIDRFDPAHFGLSPEEAKHMDPQHRLLMEMVWETIEDAGYAVDSFSGSRTGVYVGLMSDDYGQLQGPLDKASYYVGSGTARSCAAGRLSYTYGLEGPAMTLDTACSSSLVSVHLAVQALRRGECDAAIAGGANLILSPQGSVVACRSQMLSRSGHCRTFDVSADGYVRSEGCGTVLLKRLSRALQDGDQIYALIRGSAVNHDGRSQGLTAPSGQAQRKVIAAALVDAGVSPDRVEFVECHGTGTALGDPIEVRAIEAAYIHNTSRSKDESRGSIQSGINRSPLKIGALKSNLGHMEAAAGIGGLHKAMQVIRHRKVPKNLHFNELNPQIKVDQKMLQIVTEPTALATEGSLFAGVSSFGFSGTNAHIILESYHGITDSPTESDGEIFRLAARSSTALSDYAKQYLSFLARESDIDLSSLCFTAATGRNDGVYRLAFSVKNIGDLKACLEEYIEVTGGDELSLESEKVPSLWVISGQANVDWQLAYHLYSTQKKYRSSIEKAYSHLQALGYPHELTDFEALFYTSEQTENVLPHAIHRWALAELLIHLGLSPSRITGVGVGEYVAASVAGLVGWQELLHILASGKVTADISLGRKRYEFVGVAGNDTELSQECFEQSYITGELEFDDLAATFSREHGIDDYCGVLLNEGVSLTMTDGPEERLFQWVYGQTNRDVTMQLEGFLAQCYMIGYNLHWGRVYENCQRQRMSLPKYPFQRQSLWTEWGYSFDQTLPSTVVRSEMALQTSFFHSGIRDEEQIEHSVLKTVFACPSGMRNFSGELSPARMPYLSAHQILGESIVPVSLFVDIVMAAGRWCWPEHTLWIDDLHLLHKCILGDAPISIYCHVNPEAGTVAVYSKLQHSNDWQQNVRARLSSSTQLFALNDISLFKYQDKCNDAIVIRHFYQGLALNGLTYGDDFQGIFEIYRGSDCALAKIALPPTVDQSLEGYIAHPILLDSCLQAIAAASVQNSEQGVRVPSQIRGIRLFKPLPEILWCAVEVFPINSLERTGNSYASLTLFDSQGECVMTIDRFETAPYKEAETIEAPLCLDWLYDKQWLPDDVDVISHDTEETLNQAPRHWLFFSDQGPVCNALETELSSRGDLVSVVCLNQPTHSQHRQISLQSAADLHEVFAAVEQGTHTLTGVIYGWSITQSDVLGQGDYDDKLSNYAKYPLWICQSVLDPRRRQTTLNFLTCGSQPVHDETPSQPLAAMMWGHVLSFINENAMHANLIDLESYDSIGNLALSTVLNVLEQQDECQFAIRDGRRFIARILPSQLAVSQDIHIDASSTYLITGGVGALGLETAKAIIRQGARHLILVGRRAGLSDNSKVAIQSLEDMGASIYPLAVDIAEEHTFADELNERLIGLPPLRGVVHSAGVLADGIVAQQSWDNYLKVFAPKIAGTLSLYKAVRQQSLDFFVIYSSAASILGNPGQANYAAANAFVDSFAWYLRGQGVAASSINWGGWSEIGLAAGLESGLANEQTSLLGLIPPQQGIRVIEQLFANTNPQFAVLPLKRQISIDGDKMPYLRQLLSKVIDVASSGQHPVSVAPTAESQSSGMSLLARLGRLSGEARQMLLKQYLHQVIGKMLKIDGQLDERASLFDLGLDSLLGVDLRLLIEKDLDCVLASTLFHDYSTIQDLTDFILSDVIQDLEYEAQVTDVVPAATSLLASSDRNPKVGLETVTPEHNDHSSVGASDLPETKPDWVTRSRQFQNSDIAIIGLSGRYPGAPDLQTFWENLRAGYDGITPVPKERWNAEDYYDARKNIPGKSYCDVGGFIEGVDQFDPEFFNIPLHMAAYIDPKERLFLETVWNLLEDAAYTRDKLKQDYHSRVGVFVGAMYQLYGTFAGNIHEQTATLLSSYNSIAHRVSYFFNLKGPSVAVDTMCSSSLTSLHLACQSLHSGDCEIAIAGGVNLSLHPLKYVGLSQAQIMGSHPDSRSFSHGDGYLPSEGVGAVLLKPLDRAIEDGDRIEAVIKASTINHGGHSTGFYAPNPEAQSELIETNFQRANLSPDKIQYVEAAANGASLGDTVEFKVLNKVFTKAGVKEGSCPIGTVKSNIGHAEAASGMAQIAKVILQMKHRTMIPTVKATPLNPNIQFSASPFYLLDHCQDWQQPKDDTRRATVSSFGAGGANAHLILEEYLPAVQNLDLDITSSVVLQDNEIIVFSAKTKSQLQKMVSNMLVYLDTNQKSYVGEPQTWLANIAHTLQTGREEMDCRLSLLVSSVDELRLGLSRYLASVSMDDLGSGYVEQPDIPMQAGNVQDQPELRNLLLGKAGEVMAQSLIAERQMEKLMLHWVQGGHISWEKLRQNQKVKYISLPTYPFDRQRYWLTGSMDADQTQVGFQSKE